MKGTLPAILAGLLLAAFPASSHEQLAVTLKKLEERIQASPQNMEFRSERAWLLVDHGRADKAREDIRALRGNPDRAEEGEFLAGKCLQQEGKPKEAKVSVLKSLQLKPTTRKYHLLGEIERDLGSLDAALAAVGQAMALGGGDEDFVLLLQLHLAKGILPQAVWDQAMAEYPGHPAVMDGLFQFCLTEPISTKSEPKSSERTVSRRMGDCENLTSSAITIWWPESVDWRIKHARILLQAGKGRRIGPILAEALEQLDASAASRRGDPEAAMAKRREVFSLMKDPRVSAAR